MQLGMGILPKLQTSRSIIHHCRNVIRKHTARIGDFAYVDVKYHAVILAYAFVVR